jgi:GNAT superfamily N-acetyltransferase
MPDRSRLQVKPLTAARWKDFEALFGPNGACAGCWCLWCRLPSKEYKAVQGAKAKARMKKRAASGPTPGLLAYEGKEAVGWCAVGPRSEFRRLETSRLLKPLDDKPVWSAPCLFVAKKARGKGVTVELLKAAGVHAKKNGARTLEGYPVVVGGKKKTADAFLWWGTDKAFAKAGFETAAKPSASRRVVRKAL